MEAAALAHAEHHGPPPANRSSRVDHATLDFYGECRTCASRHPRGRTVRRAPR